MTAPLTADHRSASRRGLLVVLVLLYLAAQAVFAAHAVGHLLHGGETPCHTCELGGAPALPAATPSLPSLNAPFIPETRDRLPGQPYARTQRVHLPRAPPA